MVMLRVLSWSFLVALTFCTDYEGKLQSMLVKPGNRLEVEVNRTGRMKVAFH